jgi:DNA-binding transcriptional ArsR family regulator
MDSSPPAGLDVTLVALADPTRRAILQRVARREERVTDLARPFAMSLSAVSKHIRVLERARLVRRRRSGREHFLGYDPRPLDEAVAWLEAQRAVWACRLDALDALLQAEDRRGRTARTKKGASR